MQNSVEMSRDLVLLYILRGLSNRVRAAAGGDCMAMILRLHCKNSSRSQHRPRSGVRTEDGVHRVRLFTTYRVQARPIGGSAPVAEDEAN